MDDEITNKRRGAAKANLQDHVEDALSTFAHGLSQLPQDMNADAWALSRGLKESAGPMAFIAGFALAQLAREGLPKSDLPEYVRRLVEMWPDEGFVLGDPPAGPSR